MMNLVTSSVYWILFALWLTILVLYLGNLRAHEFKSQGLKLLLMILALDAFRTAFESGYFGLYFNSLYGFLPASFAEVLSQPGLLLIPKFLNIVAGFLILFLLIRYWFPRDAMEREQAFSELEQVRLEAEHLRETADREASKFKAIFHSIPEAIVFTNPDREIVSTNKGLTRIFGYTLGDLAGKKTVVLYESEDEFERQGRIRFNLTAEEKNAPYEVTYRRKNGETFVGETLGTAVHTMDGAVLGFLGVIRDVTDRKIAEDTLKLAASVFSHAREGIIITDAAGDIIDVNQTFTDITGYSREEVLGRNPRFLKSGRQGPESYAAMWEALIERNHWSGELWNKRKNGELFAEFITISAIKNDQGEVQNYVALFTDITRQKDHERKLEKIAHYDVLTGLPNRVLLADRIKQAMASCDRRNLSLAIAYLDLDDFKAINDANGHTVGDEFLIAVTSRMKTVLREGDTLARLGGDEFVALLVDLENIEDCEPVLSRLLESVCEPLKLDGVSYKVSASIGVTCYPRDGADAERLIRHADQAMYSAKQSGKNRFYIFDVTQDEAIQTRQESIHYIRQALDLEQFVLYYQPKINLKTGNVIGVEALIRWQHPERGMIPPGEFLPIIEDQPVSIDVGDWVIDTALRQSSEWRSAGLNIPISVNIGARHLQQQDFATKLASALTRFSDVQPGDLELEILETSALEDINEVTGIMHQCIDLGLSFSLDDFGTGFSSLAYLKLLPAAVLKIDQSFVRDMLDDPDDRVIVEGIIGMARAFHRGVIAEGVETEAHCNKLLEMGCEEAQGYGIARPMPAADIPGWVAEWKANSKWLK